jgi:hypothetical protein
MIGTQKGDEGKRLKEGKEERSRRTNITNKEQDCNNDGNITSRLSYRYTGCGRNNSTI